MGNSTRELADEAGKTHRVTAEVVEIHRLPFPDGAFRTIVTIGVIPFLRPLARDHARARSRRIPGGQP